MDLVRITAQNIENYRGDLKLRVGDLPFEIWQVFDKSAFDVCRMGKIVQIDELVSTKNQLLDSKYIAGQKVDPRLTAFKWMTAAAKGETKKREPISVVSDSDGTFRVDDGNATVQVLMFVGWNKVPVAIVDVDEKSAAM
ncbi:MAG TPA: hypothetical protein VFW05_09195 [Verrucomicrobiae bacterium]|nr:hypothetical protein [Verrucomicrobiae bacterium]